MASSRSTSTALWAHLLRKDTPSSTPGTSSDPLNPPIVPLDRAGTSMRMLLHDTQANFEKFSGRIDLMTNCIESTKREIVTVKSLFEEQNEKLSMEIIDLVNRSQREVQKTVASPAQANELETLRKELSSTDLRIQGLDHRLDAIHLLYQSHSQGLQAIQNQQNALLSALLPLLPLLQALPIHIDSAKDQISATVRSYVNITPLPHANSDLPSASPRRSFEEGTSTASSTANRLSVSPAPLIGRKRSRCGSPRANLGLVGNTRTAMVQDAKRPRVEIGPIASDQLDLLGTTNPSAQDSGENSSRGSLTDTALSRTSDVRIVPEGDSQHAPANPSLSTSSSMPKIQPKITSTFVSRKPLPPSTDSCLPTATKKTILTPAPPSNALVDSLAPAPTKTKWPSPGCRTAAGSRPQLSGASKENNHPGLKPNLPQETSATRGKRLVSKPESATKSGRLPTNLHLSPMASFVTPVRPRPLNIVSTQVLSRDGTPRLRPRPPPPPPPPVQKPMTRSTTMMMSTFTAPHRSTSTIQSGTFSTATNANSGMAPSMRERQRSFVRDGKRFIPIDDDDDDDDDDDYIE
ncbi:hypothetical protein PC9H_006397 [Pleurotus ostreatus]|uniref:Uncharacterized protein n=1 Tax=Pleurotus ostreatus TaxID=5322 RepID=A0A8H6ZTM8_PLEOS|nr:uncharacterized protein PC9H_006397 [Pleurotus ostreatus]KAF7430686.1 hypothetical protein PC9H_006397 [Pleurotus ostreatus]KAJ8695012.1 hypothetical protein PTI98_007640 [Pleurotus ostreatus]